MPEVSLVAILDADKEGFLRGETSLIQTIGRAARNTDGRVLIVERAAGPSDVGRRPTELNDGIAVMIHRGSLMIGFRDPDARVVEGDHLLVLNPQGGVEGTPMSDWG